MLKRVIFLVLLCSSLGQASAMHKFRAAGLEAKQYFNQTIQNFAPRYMQFTASVRSNIANLSAYRTQLGSWIREKAENPNYRLGIGAFFTAGTLSCLGWMGYAKPEYKKEVTYEYPWSGIFGTPTTTIDKKNRVERTHYK